MDIANRVYIFDRRDRTVLKWGYACMTLTFILDVRINLSITGDTMQITANKAGICFIAIITLLLIAEMSIWVSRAMSDGRAASTRVIVHPGRQATNVYMPQQHDFYTGLAEQSGFSRTAMSSPASQGAV